MSPQLQKNGPLRAFCFSCKISFVTEELHFEWLIHFKQFAKTSKDKPVLLMLDNHASHIPFGICNYCKDNEVTW
jgi:hypothetical protein